MSTALVRKVLQRTVGRMFYQGEQSYYERPHFVKRLRTKINQNWNENGTRMPFIMTAAECVAFWKSLDNASLSTGNRPEVYALKNRAIIDYLHAFWSPSVGVNDRILELGCNCGANLHWLSELGYKHLAGVEINPRAIEQMDLSFPGLRGRAPVDCGSLEEILPRMKDQSVDVTFTMGVSMHIHPEANHLFTEIARISRSFICTVEPEAANSNYVFARNYKNVFEKLGFHEVKSELLFGEAYSHLKGYNTGCIARLLKRGNT